MKNLQGRGNAHRDQARFHAWRRGLFIGGILIAMLSLSLANGWAQTTFASIVGTIHDPSGATIAGATVTVVNTGTNEQRTVTTDTNGDYRVLNLVPGAYRLRMESTGFAPVEVTGIQLLTEQNIRIDRTLALASTTQQVEVSAAALAPITTEAPIISETKTNADLTDLPIAISTRASGSTSAFTTLTTQPGVEIDNNNNISVAGTRPAQTMTSIDGLSTQSTFAGGPSGDLFPSFDAISEIHVDESNNAAEFGEVGNVVTVTKSGTNTLHGAAYDNFMNTALNARNPFSTKVAPLHMNDFGFSLGGPVVLPKLYQGKDRTFFFVDYEGLRKPGASVVVQSVPSVALRNGDLSVYKTPIMNPYTGQPFTNNQIPQGLMSPLSLKALQLLFPLPNAGAANAITNNFIENFPTPINSDQGDARVDETLGSKQTFFGRLTYKRVTQTSVPPGSILAGGYNYAYRYWSLGGGYNYIFTPSVFNEVRFGWSAEPNTRDFSMNGPQVAAQIGVTPLLPAGGIPAGVYQNTVPDFQISGFHAGEQYSQTAGSGSVQGTDNVSIVLGNHTLKFGGEGERLTAARSYSFPWVTQGRYQFNNSVTQPYIGNAFASFLLGMPDHVEVSTVTRAPFDAYSDDYGVFGQDSWKVKPSLTLSYGLRWEYHPLMQDFGSNVGDFYPDIYSVVNGQTVHGDFVVPNQRALSYVNPDVSNSIAPTPIVVASQLGLPSGLRYNPKTDFGPRIGFAWRITSDSKNVLRGGYGVYYETLYSSEIQNTFGIESGYDGVYDNSFSSGGTPTLAFPSTNLPNARPFPANRAQPGSLFLCSAYDWHRPDSRVHQWNLTYERDLGFQTGLRLSYEANHGSHLGDTVNINQVPANTIGFAAASAGAPFPAFAVVRYLQANARSNYEAFTIDLNKRISKGLQFEISYNHAVDLADGSNDPTGFQGEGGGTPTNIYDLGYDYGNVPFTRRHRFQTTFLYGLPFTYKRNAILSQAVSGWEIAGILLYQTGPFLSVQAAGADPSGTGFENITGDGRADRVAGVPLYAAQKSINEWVNPAAFAIPPDNIGRFGQSQVGSVVGPGSQVVSLSLFKSFPIYKERAKIRLGAAASNLFNHPNYLPPALDLGNSDFNTISNVQSADNGGPRQVMLSARITW